MTSLVLSVMEIEQLIDEAVADPAAFRPLYDAYFQMVHRYIVHRVLDTQTADDLAARTFERVYRSLDRYRADKASFKTWVFTIARNTVYDHLRAQRRRRWLSLDAMRDALRDGIREHLWGEPSPEQVVIADQQIDDLRRALATLSDQERELIALKFNAQMTNRSIAGLVGLSESNVGTILYRTLRKLRDELQQEIDND